jgi:hypothetical protein
MNHVHVHYEPRSVGPIAALFRSRGAFREVGFELRFFTGSPDLTTPRPQLRAVQQALLTPAVLDDFVPIVLLERADAAIARVRSETQHPNVKRVVKIATLRPPELHNHCSGRYHSTLLAPFKREPPTIVLAPEHLEKIVPGVSYGGYDRMRLWTTTPVEFSAPRMFDVHLAGILSYGERDELTLHRKSAFDTIQAIPGKHVLRDGRTMSRREYNASMLESKIVVSPWGYGELTYRDYEAMYAGCVLIKPDSRFVRAWPDVLQNGTTYVPCAPDWSDLAAQVDRVRDTWDSFEPMRRRNRQTLLDHWHPDTIARYYTGIFAAALATGLP